MADPLSAACAAIVTGTNAVSSGWGRQNVELGWVRMGLYS